VKDASGKVLHDSGFLQPNGNLDERAHSFTNRLINIKGTANQNHEVWTNRVVAYNNTIQSGRSQLVRYSFLMPKDATGPVTITPRPSSIAASTSISSTLAWARRTMTSPSSTWSRSRAPSRPATTPPRR